MATVDLIRSSNDPSQGVPANFDALLVFLAQTAHFYPDLAKGFSKVCLEMLEDQPFIDAIPSSLRKALIQCLLMMRSLRTRKPSPWTSF